MWLENLVFDARSPRTLGRFWEQALGCSTLTDTEDDFETRLSVPDGPELDLCFQRVEDPNTAPPRVHLDLFGGAQQAEVVERLLGLGATHLDIGQGDVPWVVLADPEGHPFCVMEERAAYRDTGPIAAIPVLGGDPEANARFWSELSGWPAYEGAAPFSLRHPSGHGPVLEFFPADSPKTAKNRLHLDLRIEASDPGDPVERALAMGATTSPLDRDDLPWTVLEDLGGNEFCLLRARTA
jgi:hypothetical protein